MQARAPTSRDSATGVEAVAERRDSAAVELALVRELYGPRKPLLAGNLGGAALLAAVLWVEAAGAELLLWTLLITA